MRVYEMIGTGATACIIGPRGTGKTQLATEIARRVNRHKCDQWRKRREHAHSWEPSPQAVYVHVMEIFMAIKATYQSDATQGERQSLDRFIRPRVLVIDEVQERGETDWENRMLTYILDKRYQQGRDTLLLANMKPTDIQDKLGASIVSRMQETGGIVECNWPSFRGGAK